MRNFLAKLAQRIANSYRVQNALFRSGLRTRPPGIGPIGAPLLYTHWTGLVPSRELWVNAEDPFVHFIRWAFEYRAYLTLLCGMRRDSCVLELGCNHGRTMLSLVGYLRPPGRYEGLDILREQIEFAQRRIHPAFPIFNFTVADIQNSFYNPQGRLRAESFRFPYPDDSFDIVYAASLFTHLLPEATANYFKESRRVLREGGRCLFSFCVLDYYRDRGPRAQPWRFQHPVADCKDVAVHNAERPEEVLAYTASLVREIAADAGLKTEQLIPGFWSDSHTLSLNEQDLFLLSK